MSITRKENYPEMWCTKRQLESQKYLHEGVRNQQRAIERDTPKKDQGRKIISYSTQMKDEEMQKKGPERKFLIGEKAGETYPLWGS